MDTVDHHGRARNDTVEVFRIALCIGQRLATTHRTADEVGKALRLAVEGLDEGLCDQRGYMIGAICPVDALLLVVVRPGRLARNARATLVRDGHRQFTIERRLVGDRPWNSQGVLRALCIALRPALDWQEDLKHHGARTDVAHHLAEGSLFRLQHGGRADIGTREFISGDLRNGQLLAGHHRLHDRQVEPIGRLRTAAQGHRKQQENDRSVTTNSGHGLFQ